MKNNNTITTHNRLFDALPTLLLLWGTVFIVINTRTFIGPLSESISQTFKIPGYQVVTFSTYISWGSIVSLIFSGHVSYLLMHTRTLILGLSLTIVGLMIIAFSPSLLVFKMALVLIGLGAGLHPGSGIPIANRMSSDSIRGKVLAIHETGPIGAFVFVPLFSSLILFISGWRMVVISFAVMCFILILLILLGCKEGYFRGKPLTIKNMLVLFKHPAFWIVSIAFSFTGAANILVYTILSDFLVNFRGFDAQIVSIIQSLSRVTGLLMIFFSGIVINRLSPIRIVIFTGIFSGLFTIGIGMLSGIQLLLIVFLQTFTMSGFFPAIFVAVGRYFPGSSQGLMISLMVLLSQVFGILQNKVYVFFASKNQIELPFIYIGVFIIIVSIIVVLLRKVKPFVED